MSGTYAETCWCLNEVIEGVINGMNDHQRLKSRLRRFDRSTTPINEPWLKNYKNPEIEISTLKIVFSPICHFHRNWYFSEMLAKIQNKLEIFRDEIFVYNTCFLKRVFKILRLLWRGLRDKTSVQQCCLFRNNWPLLMIQIA